MRKIQEKIPKLPAVYPFAKRESRSELITRSLARFLSRQKDRDIGKQMDADGSRKSIYGAKSGLGSPSLIQVDLKPC